MSLDNNVFNIENPDEHFCILSSRSDLHSTLNFKVRRANEDHFFLQFRNAFYFSGTIGWKSANFRVAKRQEFKSFIKNFDDALKKRLEDYFLFKAVSKDGIEISIIAAYGYRSDSEIVLPFGDAN
jgi:hypothetical protein